MARSMYSQEEQDFIKSYAWGHSYIEITAEINKCFGKEYKVSQVKSYMTSHKIRTGRTTQFEKGCNCQNRGSRHVPIGSEHFMNRNSKRRYIMVKVAEPNVWKYKHIWEWEKHHGPVPKGKLIIFADGNTLNTDISNLVMVDRAQNVTMSHLGIREYDKESMNAAATAALLKMQITSRKKKSIRRRKDQDEENM